MRACWAWIVVLAALLGPGSAWAGEPDRAGLVVQFADGQTQTLCVAFEKQITGADLLIRSGLDAVVDPSSGLGIIVCRIDGQGCDYPAEPCFCQCSGSGPCAYWNYFYREPGQDSWTYAVQGALRHTVKPGSVEAWVWGDGTVPPAADLTFEVACPSPTPSATPPAADASPQPALQPAAVTSAPTLAPAQTQPAEAPPSPGAPSPTRQGPRPEGRGDTSAYWLFGGLVLLLALAGVVVRLRTGK